MAEGGSESESSVGSGLGEGNESVVANGEVYWRGCSMEEIHRGLNEFELEHVAAVRPSQTHSVLYHFPIRDGDKEPPRPLRAQLKWDAQHVRLPCSSKSQYPVTAPDGSSTIESRWEMIEKALLQPINNWRELQEAIVSYNTKYKDDWRFVALYHLFEKELDESEAKVFFEDLLPRIIRLALRLPELVQAPIPLLKQGQTHSISLTQQQISCLLANAFLCTFPRRNTMKKRSEYSTFPDINFNRLFMSQGPSVLEKLKCICHYFRRVCPTECNSSNVPTGVVTFTRKSLQNSELPKWANCETPIGITPLHITSEGTIEDQGLGLLQVDFANKFLGGGVLGHGCVQEEIRFVICPELLISRLFTECLRPTEALLMVGCERYSDYTGYANTFQWAGNHEDNIPRDSSRRRMTHIVAIDALSFRQDHHQYREELMLRELNKAYVGFLHQLQTPAPGVASGNWGCGAFGGDAKLKALLQLMVCTVTNQPLVYYTFGNAELRDEVHRMHTFFLEHDMRVKDLWTFLTSFQAQQLDSQELYNFIYGCIRNTQKHSPKTMKQSPSNKTTMKNFLTNWCKPKEAAKTAQSKPKPPYSNLSQDIFASSDESEAEAAKELEDSPIIIVSSSSSPATSASVVATVDCTNKHDNESESAVCSTDKSKMKQSLKPETKEIDQKDGSASFACKDTAVKTPKPESRQRTLLEMLDQCYTEGKEPDSKRSRFSRIATNANQSPKKQ